VSESLIASVMPRLTDRIHQLMAEPGVPGVALGIVRDQDLLWSGGFGYADLESGRPMDADTMFGVASITKTFTSTAIMQLRDRSRLSLDDPVARYIPEIRKVRCRFGTPRDITLRRLMTHQSGLVGEAPTGHWWTMKFPSVAQILAMLPTVEVVNEPEAAFKYNNLAFVLLGEVVARVARRTWKQYVRQQILEPLGMESSGFEVDNARNATGYMPERYQDVPEVAPDPPTNGYLAAAGLRSCVTDLARWISFQFRTDAAERSGAQVLSGKSLSEMHRVTFVEPGWLAGYALTWMAIRVGENVYLHHGGSVPGFLSMIAFNKPHRVGVVALTNKQGHIASGTIALDALEMLTAAAKKETRAPTPRSAPAHLKPLLGRYMGMPAFGVMFQVEWRDGELRLTTPSDPFMMPLPPSALAATDKPNAFTVQAGRLAGEPLTFQFDADGRVTGLQLSAHGGLFRKTD
jgi:CubicO group peptidase (beta-lactamase class C family)